MLKHLKSSIAAKKLIAVLAVTMLVVAMACNGEEDPSPTLAKHTSTRSIWLPSTSTMPEAYTALRLRLLRRTPA